MARLTRRKFLKGIGLIGGALAAQTAPAFLREGLGAQAIKWGMITPTTGPYATEAFDQVEGAKIAIEDINKAGGVDGRQVELLFRDDQFKWEQTTTHALDLLDSRRRPTPWISWTTSGWTSSPAPWWDPRRCG
ncbi:MAG: ABC transporter substrate-binding protein [Candidatus Tectomicrobia bacterium]|nr:ABC transporter substrate-binding protein [Candidatus Tectomicrobia bacterium]